MRAFRVDVSRLVATLPLPRLLMFLVHVFKDGNLTFWSNAADGVGVITVPVQVSWFLKHNFYFLFSRIEIIREKTLLSVHQFLTY